ncbi:MAG: glycosyltransferase family 2 protein [Chthoniobacteraceae bacterium]
MLISIVTPSFRGSEWLKLCIASVADQKGVAFEHIIQDSCSDDGTQDWLPNDVRVKAYIEKDKGMYDAVNHGFKRSKGDILAYLNCDEQYLPGALKAVHDFFEAHPDVDVLFADTIVIDAAGSYICHRKSHIPTKSDIWVRMPVMTCAMFMRRSVFEEHGTWFDTKWKDFGDLFWVMSVVNKDLRIKVMHTFTSLFTDTGENMNLKPNARREAGLKYEMTPRWIKALKPLLLFSYKIKFVLSGLYFQKPFDYAVYVSKDQEKRVTYHVEKPTPIWKGRKNVPVSL